MSAFDWFPPTSLTGRHWRIEVRHIDGSWRCYTEHMTQHDAESALRYRHELSPLDEWRVVEAHR
jgi:hypothetical protein